MMKSARDTACENSVMGLRSNLMLRVRVLRPEKLQEAIKNFKNSKVIESPKYKKHNQIRTKITSRKKKL